MARCCRLHEVSERGGKEDIAEVLKEAHREVGGDTKVKRTTFYFTTKPHFVDTSFPQKTYFVVEFTRNFFCPKDPPSFDGIAIILREKERNRQVPSSSSAVWEIRFAISSHYRSERGKEGGGVMRCPGEKERKRKSRERRPNWFLSEKVTLPTFAIFAGEKKVRCGFFLSFYLGKRD